MDLRELPDKLSSAVVHFCRENITFKGHLDLHGNITVIANGITTVAFFSKRVQEEHIGSEREPEEPEETEEPEEGDDNDDQHICPCGAPNDDEEMIGCDGEHCPVQWYHYTCAGIVKPPSGNWYCHLCTESADNSDANNSDDSEELFQHVQNFHRGKAKELSFVQQALGRSLSDGEYPDDDEKQSSKAGTRQAAMFFPSDLDGTNSDSAIEQSAAPPWNKPSRSLPASQASSPTQPSKLKTAKRKQNFDKRVKKKQKSSKAPSSNDVSQDMAIEKDHTPEKMVKHCEVRLIDIQSPPHKANLAFPSTMPPHKVKSEISPTTLPQKLDPETPSTRTPPQKPISKTPSTKTLPQKPTSETPSSSIPTRRANSETPSTSISTRRANSETPSTSTPPQKANSETPSTSIPTRRANSETPSTSIPTRRANSETPSTSTPPQKANSETPSTIPPQKANSEIHTKTPAREGTSIHSDTAKGTSSISDPDVITLDSDSEDEGGGGGGGIEGEGKLGGGGDRRRGGRRMGRGLSVDTRVNKERLQRNEKEKKNERKKMNKKEEKKKEEEEVEMEKPRSSEQGKSRNIFDYSEKQLLENSDTTSRDVETKTSSNLLVVEQQKTHQQGLPHTNINNNNNNSGDFNQRSNVFANNEQQTDFPFRCNICDMGFRFKPHLFSHKGTHVHTSETYVCQKCGMKFTYKHSLQRHLLLNCTDEASVCEFCGKSFFIESQLKEHLLLHSKEEEYRCVFCRESYTGQKALLQHRRDAHPEKCFPCSKCHKLYDSVLQLNSHIARKHTGQETSGNSEMDQSESVTASPNSLTVNESLYSEHVQRFTGETKPFKCLQCEKRFATLSDLTNHKKNGHTEKGSIIERTAPQETMDHYRPAGLLASRGTLESAVSDGASKKGIQHFRCNTCSKLFPLRISLNKHKKNCP